MRAAPCLALGWTAVVVAAGWARRPRLVRRPPAAPASNPRPTAGAAGELVVRVGRLVGALPALVGGPSADADGDLARGAGVLAAVALVPVAPLLAPAALAAPPVLRVLRRRAAGRRHTRRVHDGLAHATDLLGVAVGAGLTVPLAVEVVGHRVGGPVGSALSRAHRRAAAGRPLDQELRAGFGSLGVDGVRLATLLASSLRYGAPLAEPLDRLGSELRSEARRRSEVAARRLPVKLLFPLVGCLLPAFVLLTVVPVLLTSVGSLRLAG